MLARDQFLRQPLADLRIGGIVAPQDLELDARRQILLVLLDVQIDGLLRLVRCLGDKPGIAADQPDLDDRLGRRRYRQQRERRSNRRREQQAPCFA